MWFKFFKNRHFGKTCQLFSWGQDVTKHAKIVTKSFLKKSIWRSILNQLIQTNRCTRALTAIMHILNKGNCKNILNKTHKCSICDLSFSRIDISERHANYFHEDRMSQKRGNCKNILSKTHKCSIKDMPIIFMRPRCQNTC